MKRTSLLSVIKVYTALFFLFWSGINIYAGQNSADIDILKKAVIPINYLSDYDALIDWAGQKNIVLIGDSTHGSHEFYQQRIEITRRLITEKGFRLVALEGDWPNVYKMNRFIHSQSPRPLNARQAVQTMNPDAPWLWGTQEMLDFVVWLKQYNEQLPQHEEKVSLYGMDMYSFDRSITEVIHYLKTVSPAHGQLAASYYACFDQAFDQKKGTRDLHLYGYKIQWNPERNCRAQAEAVYSMFTDCLIACPEHNNGVNRNEFFYAQQNALVIKNSEAMYWASYVDQAPNALWNLRDEHMLESLQAMFEHLNHPKTVVWAHNSHFGYASATEMQEQGMTNVGELLREQYNDEIYNIGFLTHHGQVMAADEWNVPPHLKTLLPAHVDSNEALFNQLGIDWFILDVNHSPEVIDILNKKRLQRHVGVIYRQNNEMEAHYSYTHLGRQFDAIIFIDQTTGAMYLR
jgi:erythromycin esterase-like protein